MTSSPSERPYKKWFGVNGLSSIGLADWYVNGLEFRRDSAPASAVVNSSSVIAAGLGMALRDLLVARIMISCTPPK